MYFFDSSLSQAPAGIVVDASNFLVLIAVVAHRYFVHWNSVCSAGWILGWKILSTISTFERTFSQRYIPTRRFMNTRFLCILYRRNLSKHGRMCSTADAGLRDDDSAFEFWHTFVDLKRAFRTSYWNRIWIRSRIDNLAPKFCRLLPTTNLKDRFFVRRKLQTILP